MKSAQNLRLADLCRMHERLRRSASGAALIADRQAAREDEDGRTRTSNQTVVNDMLFREATIKPRSIVSDCRHSTPFVHGLSVGYLCEEAPGP